MHLDSLIYPLIQRWLAGGILHCGMLVAVSMQGWLASVSMTLPIVMCQTASIMAPAARNGEWLTACAFI
jgi:hypothetical protein